MHWRNSSRRFGTLAALFHWIIVAGLIAQYFLAEAGESEAPAARANYVMGLHRSIGWTILVLAVLRLVWRCVDDRPRWPVTMKPYERVLAQAVHASFYMLLFALPLSGWALSSIGGETLWFFGWLEVLALPASASMEHTLEEVHEMLFNVLLVLAIVHILAALKHQLIDRDGVLKSMLPGGG